MKQTTRDELRQRIEAIIDNVITNMPDRYLMRKKDLIDFIVNEQLALLERLEGKMPAPFISNDQLYQRGEASVREMAMAEGEQRMHEQIKNLIDEEKAAIEGGAK